MTVNKMSVARKICTKCNLEKDIADFYRTKVKEKPVTQSRCKQCVLKVQAEDRVKNKKKYIDKNKKYYQENKEKHAASGKAWYEKNRESVLLYKKDWREKNKPKILEQARQYRNREGGRDRYNKFNVCYLRKRRAEDILFALSGRVSSLIRISIKKMGYPKKSKTRDILGCSYDDFKAYFESKFTDGMSWDNRGAWHIDHIIPISSAKTEDDVIRLNHYTNLQPLWAIDNLKKGSKY